ncbi:hypothetical protein [Kribbella sp. VKM Ac-2568]|uniref:hypothetical protein n=1 Tax=Kribbella sp. VKM Ac-2568 TaxID=2512219 RepID=UPI00104FE47A|nr:hypothetical protein [Kribbella sp. VKM Ac-2568]TCM38980.1 hypothetical protein EV648_11597 [Kribbella sp. VKM Ac-2568]
MSRREGEPRRGKRIRSGSDDADSFDLPRPEEPESWRDMVRPDYSYPEELDDLGRRDRRQAKRTWRKDDHAQRMAWLRQQRQAEPTSPATVIVAIVILAIVLLGFGGGLPRLFGGDEPAGKDVGLLTPSLPPEQPAPSEPGSTPSQSTLPPTSENSTPPVLTEHPSALATSAAAAVATNWARTFYTRDPVAETYADLVDKTGPYITDEVGDSLVAAGDSTYDALKTDGGKSTVASVTVALPRPDSAPVDTPTRISRLLTVTIDVTGKNPDRIVLPLVITLVPEGTVWVVSDLNGGSGP